MRPYKRVFLTQFRSSPPLLSLLPRYFNWAKINRVGNGRARSRYFSTLASAGNRARILEYRDSWMRMFLDDEKVEKCDFLCFSSFLSKFYILFLFLLSRIDRFLDLFQKLDESGVRWIIRNVVERVSEIW